MYEAKSEKGQSSYIHICTHIHGYTHKYTLTYKYTHTHANECAANAHAEILIVALSAPNTI
jgi:hypothetical protein